MKLIKMGVANYRAFKALGPIDPTEIEAQLHWVDLSADIVLVAGENNAGKTSILSAYRDFRGSKTSLSQNDFYNNDASNPVIMELVFQAETENELDDEKTAKWFSADKKQARVRKVWNAPDSTFEKYSFDPETSSWIEKGFGGFDSILQNRLPEPVHIRPDMSSEELRSELNKLFKEIVSRYISGSDTAKSINALLEKLSEEIEDDDYIKSVADRVGNVARDIFPDIEVKFENPASNKGVLALLEKQTSVELELSNSPKLNVTRHGQGSQRVLILSALSSLSSELSALSQKSKTPPKEAGGKIIQIEEPELYLSPTATRRMKQLLYKLASQEKIQVMACTHSPVMIDFSRPKQTIVRVEKGESGSKVFQSNPGNWGKDQTETLKLMYQWNPALSEAIFANKVILVEGETEFASITRLIEIMETEKPELDIHIIDCKGKGSIQHYQRLLRDMGRRYLVVHDTDVKYAPNDPTVQSRWDENETIWEEVALARTHNIDAIGFAFNPDFESEHKYEAQKPKMLNAMNFIQNSLESGSLEEMPIYRLYMCIKEWASPYKNIETIRSTCAP